MKLKKLTHHILLATTLMASAAAHATAFTSTSPSGANVTSVGASTVGGIVVNLVGLNNVSVISQLAASSLFVGFYNSGTPAAFNGNPGTIGIQTGFSSAVTNALGGGLSAAHFRFTLWDGDSAAGDFDFNDNTLEVNGLTIGNWSTVNTQNTDGSGNLGSSGFSTGFRDNILDTGWFSATNSTLLANLYSSITGTQQLTFKVNDTDPYDNYYDFTQGINSSLLNVGTGPRVVPAPEPEAIALFTLGLAAFGAMRRKAKA